MKVGFWYLPYIGVPLVSKSEITASHTHKAFPLLKKEKERGRWEVVFARFYLLYSLERLIELCECDVVCDNIDDNDNDNDNDNIS